MSYESDQDKWIKEVNLQVGDKVLVVATAESHSNGWRNSWNPDGMWAGEVYTVAQTYQAHEPELGIGLRVPKDKYSLAEQDVFGFPFFVLVKLGGKE